MNQKELLKKVKEKYADDLESLQDQYAECLFLLKRVTSHMRAPSSPRENCPCPFCHSKRFIENETL